MPNQFILVRKTDDEKKPVKFSIIDDEMRKHFGIEPDPKNYFRNWYNAFADAFALGKTWDDFRVMYSKHYSDSDRSKKFYNDAIKPMIDWLDENFKLEAWYALNTATCT